MTAVHHERNRGIEAAWKSGLEASSGRVVCVIDSDLQYMPEDVWRLYREYLGSPEDVVRASAAQSGARTEIRDTGSAAA